MSEQRLIEEEYKSIANKYGLSLNNEIPLTSYITRYITSFMKLHKRVAIYCYGWHTQMLMIDYVFLLKQIVAIIDNNVEKCEVNGFRIIRDESISDEHIDGIIISSYVYREEIKELLSKNHPDIEVLDIYDEFEKDGISLRGSYYSVGHPYYNYQRINENILTYEKTNEILEKKELLSELIRLYLKIKDFRMASKTANELFRLSKEKQVHEMQREIEALYELELKTISELNDNNCILMCLDGMRACDLDEETMPKITKLLTDKSYYFESAYSYSTSTYESLIPSYSENTDYSSRYYECNEIDAEQCRFVKKCFEQDRGIYFYTDASNYIKSDEIRYGGKCQTITERMWDFLIDAQNENNGFFYIHHLYESHFSFPSPYCSEPIVADGTAMLFDYLPQKGGKLRTDYEKQQRETLRYIDDTLSPMIEKLKCRMLLFADHGNMILDKDAKLEDINFQYLTCHEEWLRIPFAIISPENGKNRDNRLFSLININDVVIALLEHRKYDYKERDYIKCGRSELYNPDFRYLYNRIGEDKRLLAFECFVFDEYKVVVYKDGSKELYSKKDELIDNHELLNSLLEVVKKDITVY